MNNIKLSIIIPCYNEGQKLIDNIKKINTYLKQELPSLNYEIIGVNDGSKDNTKEIMKENEYKLLNTKFISYEINRGKGGAVKEGVLNAKGEWILFMDADLSTDISAISGSLLYSFSNRSNSLLYFKSKLWRCAGILIVLLLFSMYLTIACRIHM